MNVALRINHAQRFDLNVDLHLVYVDDVVSPIVKFNDVQHHASLLLIFY